MNLPLAPVAIKGNKRSRLSKQDSKIVLVGFMVCCVVFYAGVLTGAHFLCDACHCNDIRNLEKRNSVLLQDNNANNNASNNNSNSNKNGSSRRFDTGMRSFANGMSMVSRDEFNDRFDMGVPLAETTTKTNDKVLILYSGDRSLPSSNDNRHTSLSQGPVPFIEDVEEAVENCDVMNVVLTQPDKENQCIAVMGQYNAYHLQHWMRMPEKKIDMKTFQAGGRNGGKKSLSHDYPLRFVSRNSKANGEANMYIPKWTQHTQDFWNNFLLTYLQTFEETLKELKPIAKKIADKNKNIIVMVTNYGQVEMLMNFVCSAKNKNLDLSNVLVFATDEETKELATGMGLTAFYDQKNFEKLPKTAADHYGDPTFKAVMMAKVYCVQMINTLGYNVLFQDVDLIWYRHPLDYFNALESKEAETKKPAFDIYFQEDGNHGFFYAPYSANTGFYYVRYNDRTRFFFSSLLVGGDMISAARSHQIALTGLLAEHASLYGLRVKILEAHNGLFPGGYSFHRPNQKDYMKQLLAGPGFSDDKQPYVFHMSWTEGKDNKKKFFEQMGQWYFNDYMCLDKKAHEITSHFYSSKKHEGGHLTEMCCLAKPAFACHYKDKPSVNPCPDSPPVDKGRPSWW